MKMQRVIDHTIRRCCSGVIGPLGSWPCCAAGAGGVLGLSMTVALIDHNTRLWLLKEKIEVESEVRHIWIPQAPAEQPIT